MTTECGKKKHKKSRIYSEKHFFAFISLWMIGFLLLTVVPMIYSLYASFTSWDGINPPNWIGLDNFKKIFIQDDLFLKSLWNTFRYTILTVPLNMVIGMLLAVLLNQNLPGTNLYRSIFYLPSVIAGVAMYIGWQFIFDRTSILSYWVSKIFGSAPGWLTDPKWSMPSLILMNIFTSGSIMLILLAALQDVPKEYYEAARIDGANRTQQFFKITLPMITPILFYVLIMQMMSALQIFTQPFVMTKGGPMNSIYTYGIHLYNQAFRYNFFGYSCALSWILFIIIMFITILLFKSSKLWVFYREEVD
ncbi:sugar ABC transporter permease [Eubacteriales bacterium mix99]